MPHLSKACDIYQGFNFKKDKQTTVGFVTTLKINNVQLDADITCKDPLNPTTDMPVVAVLSDASFATGVTDPIHFAGQISAPNRQNIALMQYNDLTVVEVLFKYDIYEYDPVNKKYFKCFHCGGTEMKGLLEKVGSNLSISVADEQSNEVQSPINYSFHVGIAPQPIEQAVTLATADQKNVVKKWGIKG